MKPKTNIREATAADLTTILRFEQGVVKAERPFISALKSGTVHYYDMAAMITSDQTLVLVAECSGVLIGTGHATLRTSLDYLRHDRDAYLGLMYVEPDFRGQGIVKDIIETLLAWARSEGVVDFYLDVIAENEPAVRAYEKFGFERNLIEMKLHD
jgi:ribosomal protein S18 acetylase RimI-like enzyme